MTEYSGYTLGLKGAGKLSINQIYYKECPKIPLCEYLQVVQYWRNFAKHTCDLLSSTKSD